MHNSFAVNIANFNPRDGDKIKLHRSLLNSQSLIFKKSKKTGKKIQENPLSFVCVLGDSGNYKDGPNMYYNDAGQFILMLTAIRLA